jgi:superoxide reductase
LWKQKGGKPMATKAGEVYECEVCGAVVEVKEGGAGELVCCDQPMTLKE